MKNKTMPIAPAFFLPLSLFMEFFGVPKGSAAFKWVEELSGVELKMDPKTLRKSMRKEAKISKKTNAKFVVWLERVVSPSWVAKQTKFPESMLGRRIAEADWRTFIHSLQGETSGPYPKTLEYMNQLLDAEAIYYKNIVFHKNDPLNLLRASFSEGFHLKYGLSLPEGLVDEVATQSPNNPLKAILKKPVLIGSLIHGMISLKMDIFARAEVEWLEGFNPRLLEEKHFNSQLKRILPVIENGKLTSPIRAYFVLVKEHFEFSSWKKMAKYVEMDGVGDIEDGRRKLMGWVSGEHHVSVGVILPFLRRLIEVENSESSTFYLDLFFAASFISRLTLLMQQEANIVGDIPIKSIEAAFSTYQGYFEKHKTAALAEAAV